MIAQLEGFVIHKNLRFIILDVNGVGYKITIGADAFEKINRIGTKDKIRFWTHLAVREDALDLYGFVEEEELRFFEMLIGISGIGPKTAIGILSSATLGTLRSAIASGDSSHLTKVGGIGKKNAEKIVLELKDKIGATEEEKASLLQGESDVMEALISLGYSQKDARDALKKAPKEGATGEKIKHALKVLAGKN